MFREYAMDPAVINGWARARYFLGAFGPWNGRFLAEIPAKWKRMVYEGLQCPPLEKARVIERMRRLDPRVFSHRSGFAYDSAATWLSNALRAHGQEAFHAIIAAEAQPRLVLDAELIDDTTPEWRVEPGKVVDRTAAGFAAALRLLLMRAEEKLVVIDPYFSAGAQGKRSLLAALCGLLDAVKVTVHVHATLANATFDHRASEVEQKLAAAIPAGVTVNVDFWEVPETLRFHNRYVLTEAGGVQLGDGLEEGAPGHQDRLSLLGEGEHATLYAQYSPHPTHLLPTEGGRTLTVVGTRARS